MGAEAIAHILYFVEGPKEGYKCVKKWSVMAIKAASVMILITPFDA